MVSPFEAAGLLVLVGLNTLIAAVLTRAFRVRLNTRWGGALYTLLLTPVVLTVVTLVLGQALGPNLGAPATVVGLTVLLPLTLGIAFDYFWMPSPEEVDVPDTL
ncbi:MAG: hypothetical protein ACI8UR_001562 [Natronomonas sp.]|jgi:hypothetical protein|uniref:hypothetical protein n=1 Tax=Natronomonas sp. TaxID=2184060 RepID=UPI003989F89A